jgi:DNA-directed RNA polymerase subunit RPC12/RpoP
LPLEESTLYECPKCGEHFEALTFAKMLQCPFCLELFEKILPHPGPKKPNESERMVIMRKK